MGAVNFRDSIVPGKTLINKSVVRGQHINDVAILADDAFKEQFRFTAETLPQIVVPVRKESSMRSGLRQIPQLKPLCGEVRHQGLGSRIREHAPHLLLEYCGIAQSSLAG